MAQKLTKALIDSLPFSKDGNQLTVMDTTTPGFGLRIGGQSKTFIAIKRTPHGTPKRVTLGKYGALTLDSARKMAMDVLSQLTHGVDINAEKKALKGERHVAAAQDVQTLGWLFKEYKEKHLIATKGGSAGTLQSMKDCEDMFKERRCQTLKFNKDTDLWEESKVVMLKDWLDTPLRSIVPTEILRRFEVMEVTRPSKLIGGKLAPMVRTHQVGYKFAQGAFEFFIPRNFHSSGQTEMLENPFKILKVFNKWKAVGVRSRFVDFQDSDEFGPWWSALQKYREIAPVPADYIEFSILQGGRSIEIVNMTWSMVDLRKMQVTYNKTKNKESYTIPLSKRALAILTHRLDMNPKGNEWVWYYPESKTMHIPKDTKHHFHKLEELGGKYVTAHDLKRTWASAAHSFPDFKERDVDYLLKHKHSDVNKHYYVKNEPLLRKILQAVEDMFLSKAAEYDVKMNGQVWRQLSGNGATAKHWPLG